MAGAGHLPDDLLEFEDAGAIQNGGYGLGGPTRGQLDDPAFLVLRGVFDDHLEHEAIKLGLGQGVGAFLLDGVLGGHHDEGFFERVGLAAHGDLALLHGFQQGRLGLGRGAVDLVSQDCVGKDGTAGRSAGCVCRLRGPPG